MPCAGGGCCPETVFYIVTGEPFKQSAELTREPIKMKGKIEHCPEAGRADMDRRRVYGLMETPVGSLADGNPMHMNLVQTACHPLMGNRFRCSGVSAEE